MGDFKKALTVPAYFRTHRVHGLPPSKDQIEALKLAEKKPPKFKTSMLFDHTEPRFTAASVVDNLGLSTSKQKAWVKFLTEHVRKADNEIVLRQVLYSKLMADKEDPALRRVLFQRSMNFWKETMKKSMRVMTPSELKKAEPRGGNYVKRVPMGKGKYRYYYDEDKYRSEYEHVDGAEAFKSRMSKKVRGTIGSWGDKGCPIKELKAHAKRFGKAEVSSLLKEQCQSGGMTYKDGKVYLGKLNAGGESEQESKKAQRKPKTKMEKSFVLRKNQYTDFVDLLCKAGGPFVGPRGGLWADAKHTIHWDPKKHGAKSPQLDTTGLILNEEMDETIDKLVALGTKKLQKLLTEIAFRKKKLSAKKEATPLSLIRWGRAVVSAHAKAKVIEEKKPEDKPAAGGSVEVPVPKPEPSSQSKPPEKKKKPVRTKAKPKRPKMKATPLKPEAPQPPSTDEKRLDRVGEHVDGAIRDRYLHLKSLKPEDLKDMSWAEAASVAKRGDIMNVPTLEMMRAAEVRPEVAFELLEMVASIKSKSTGQNPAEHMQYVADIRAIEGAMLEVKTRQDLYSFRSELWQRILKSPKWDHHWTGKTRQEADAKLAELQRDNPGVKYKLLNRYSYQTYESKYYISTKAKKNFASLGRNFEQWVKQKGTRADSRFWHRDQIAAMTPDDAWAYIQAVGEKREEIAKQAKEKKKNTTRGRSKAKVEQKVIRKGGKEIKNADPERVHKAFNLMEVDFGNSMTQSDREFHVKELEGALYDLSDMMGVEPGLLSFQQRLSIAMGARGRGKAKAHYEPDKKAINITRFSGAGSVAHEWGHALDNIIAEHFVPSTMSRQSFLSTMGEDSRIPEGVREAAKGVYDSMMKGDGKHRDHLMSQSKQGMDKLGKSMREVNAIISEERRHSPSAEDLEKRLARIKEILPGLRKDLKEASANLKAKPTRRMRELYDLAKARVESSERRLSTLRVRDTAKLQEAQTSYESMRQEYNQHATMWNVLRKVPKDASKFYVESVLADGGKSGKTYYSTTHEMFARAFEAHVHNRLRKADRRNDYLVDGHKFETYGFYPQGKELDTLGQKFDDLMKVIQEDGLLHKALSSVLC